MMERMSLPRWGKLVRTLILSVGLVWGMAACGEDEPQNEGPKECAQACAANQACNDGVCICEAGFLDCDGVAANGCEQQGGECVACTPQSDADLCQRAGAVCGEVTMEDNCGNERTVVCGACGDDEHCDDGQCVSGCAEESDEAFCARLEVGCGEITADDNCGVERTVACGLCGPDHRCEDNVCVCVPEEDDAFCDRLGANCGDVTADDNCGETRTVTCGTCGDDETCNAENVCVCEGESDEDLCSRHAANCGELTTEDRCGIERTVQCGTCPSGELCGLDVENVCGICTPEDDATFCGREGATCGAVTAMDNCLVERTADCGTCAGDAICTASNVCCQPEDDATFCATHGADCGSVMHADSCGTPRVVNCGTCAGPAICTSLNVCCEPEDDAAFCANHGATCGEVTAIDGCGFERTATCGTCADPDICGASNFCCQPETDAMICSAAGATCGQVTTTDACGEVRTVTCGTCTGDDVCMSNQCIELDGEWTNELCIPYYGLNCATGLSCIVLGQDIDWDAIEIFDYGVCKQPCDADVDCTFGGTCLVDFLRNNQTGATFGICGQVQSVGESCQPGWTDHSQHCWDPANPSLYLECVNSTCNYVCDWTTRVDPPLPCPSGMSCGATPVSDPYFNPDIFLCQ